MRYLFVLALLIATFPGSNAKGRLTPMVGAHVADFSLKNIDGNTVSLGRYKDARGFIIIFSCNHCPFAKLYTDRFNKLHQEFLPEHVPVLVINPMDTLLYEEEGFALMQQRAKEAGYQFPYLQDAAQQVARSFKASHTPHAFVIWKEKEDWVIRYAGAIDDNGSEPEKAHPFVADAVHALLSGKAVTRAQTESLGCGINYR